MKKYIIFVFIGLILTACEFKTNIVLPEKDKNEIEINVIKEKIEMAEKEIKLLMEINTGIIDYKILSKEEIKRTKAMKDKLYDTKGMIDLEFAENCDRIYVLMNRIKEWNEKLNQLY